MKDYKYFTVQDFIEDDYFRSWVLQHDKTVHHFWEEWLRENPGKQPEITEARQILQSIRFSNHTLLQEEEAALWQQIKSYPHDNEETVSQSFYKGAWFKVAASVALFAILFMAVRQWGRNATHQYHTAYGETKTILLPDSSTVILNSNSTLTFSADWDKQPVREIWLDGEAFFSVMHKQNDQPFRVQTDEGVQVEVLGTTFNVYHRTRETKVVLNTGSIQLHLPSESATRNIMMKPGDFVEYKEKTFSKRHVDPAVYSAWTEKKIILDHISLREMVDMLRDNYGITVIVQPDSLLNQTASGSMPVLDGDNLVKQIASVFQLKVSKKDNQFLLQE